MTKCQFCNRSVHDYCADCVAWLVCPHCKAELLGGEDDCLVCGHSVRSCEDCGALLSEVDQPTPLRVWHCAECAKDGPSESQISDAYNRLPDRPFTMADKDYPERWGR